MIGQETTEVERKALAILKVLRDAGEPLGARVISQRLTAFGVELGERAVRYHLKWMDERGLTKLVGRDGRLITEHGIEELGDALVRDKVGLAFTRIELLAFRTNFNLDKGTGLVPVNISFFRKDKFHKALQEMKPVFGKGLCVSERVAIAKAGEYLGDMAVPKGCMGIATVCSIVINGTLLKAGIPIDSRFSGIIQIKDGKPRRFVELIHYSGTSIDPSEVFIRARMTSIREVIKKGEGKLLANFREIPALCLPIAEEVIAKLKKVGVQGLLLMGNVSEPVCEIPVELNRIGMILYGGLNPVAAAAEVGFESENHGMSTMMNYHDLTEVWNL